MPLNFWRPRVRGLQELGKKAFSWTPTERFPSASTVGADLGERLLAQRFPPFADTVGVTGSNPVAPTTSNRRSGRIPGSGLLLS